MDAVEGGQAFTVTRDGREIGELIPTRRRRRFVPRGEFAAISRNAPTIGQVVAAVVGAGRKTPRRAVDLMIAAVAIAEELPLFTTRPAGFAGLGHLLTVVPVTGPETERQP